MLVLGIETSTPQTSVALGSETGVVAASLLATGPASHELVVSEVARARPRRHAPLGAHRRLGRARPRALHRHARRCGCGEGDGTRSGCPDRRVRLARPDRLLGPLLPPAHLRGGRWKAQGAVLRLLPPGAGRR